jgi:hypothetical protein
MEEKIKVIPHLRHRHPAYDGRGHCWPWWLAFSGDPQRGWANFLLNNVYFVSLAAGALLFCLHAAGHPFVAGRQALSGFPKPWQDYLPVAAILFLVMIFRSTFALSLVPCRCRGSSIPCWPIRAPYLNLPFWSLSDGGVFCPLDPDVFDHPALSLKEDARAVWMIFKKLEHRAKIFIFIIIITFSFAMIDWVMSIDAHWYSTIFAVKNFVAAFHHAAIVITFIVLLMLAT